MNADCSEGLVMSDPVTEEEDVITELSGIYTHLSTLESISTDKNDIKVKE